MSISVRSYQYYILRCVALWDARPCRTGRASRARGAEVDLPPTPTIPGAQEGEGGGDASDG